MAKAKIAKKSTFIDMTPMVDLAFLLITFFMLTVKFRPQESVEVSIPSSIAETPIPASDLMLITISDDGRVFFSVDSKVTREQMLPYVQRQYNLSFTEDQAKIFAIQSDIGVDIARLGQWLDLEPEARKKQENSPGIPVDSTRNELQDWIVFARLSNPKLKIAVKADEDAKWPVVKRVMDTLQDKKIDKFNLVTGAEAVQTAAPATP
ncbi:MAG: biopolymer transporter ExbD [Bacteroidia bacterium]|nr:biopolymer transporter ExbD [Bacteroidia bacterium]